MKLIFTEQQPDKISALKRERAIKKMTREQKKNLIKKQVTEIPWPVFVVDLIFRHGRRSGVASFLRYVCN